MSPSPFDAMPVTRPEAIAPDTFLIPNLAPGPDGLFLPDNSMVIRGREPIGRQHVALVGTGDRRWELLFPPEVPFLCLDSFGLGTNAADLLNDLIDGKDDPRREVETVMPARFVDASAE